MEALTPNHSHATDTVLNFCPSLPTFSEAVIFGEGLVGRVLELLRHIAWSPAERVVVDLREHELRLSP